MAKGAAGTISSFSPLSPLIASSKPAVISWFQYDPASDFLIESYLPEYIRARNWRSEKDWAGAVAWNVTLDGYGRQTIADGVIIMHGHRSGKVLALHSSTGKTLWEVITSAVGAKQRVVLVSGAFWYHGFSAGSGSYLSVGLEKRNLHDGSLVWVRSDIASVQYGWFDMALSENASLLYVYPSTQGAWIAALRVDTASATVR